MMLWLIDLSWLRMYTVDQYFFLLAPNWVGNCTLTLTVKILNKWYCYWYFSFFFLTFVFYDF